MKIRLTVPVVYQHRAYSQGTVLEVSAFEGSRMIHHRVAVPILPSPQRQVMPPPEVRRG